MRTTAALISVALTLGLAAAAQANTIALSTFDTEEHGWVVGDFYALTISPLEPTFMPDGGVPGTGFISTTDMFGWNAFQAPGDFLGNMLGAYGGSLSFYSSAVGADTSVWAAVTLSNGTHTLQFETTAPSPAWTFFDVPLTPGPGWRVASGPGNGLQPTVAQMQSVISNLLFLHISADWSSGQDLVGLDTVELCGPSGCDSEIPAVSEPATLSLLAAGCLVGLSRRLRRRRASWS
jgi:hypothetical protein